MRRLSAFVLVVLTVACGGGGAVDDTTETTVVTAAKAAYAKARLEGVDMTNGPCLGVIVPNWVADVAHDPRQPVDDDPANQCEAYRAGEAEHFVELDPDGNVIRLE